MNFMQFEWYRGYCISRLVSKDQYFGAGLIYCYPPEEEKFESLAFKLGFVAFAALMGADFVLQNQPQFPQERRGFRQAKANVIL